MTTPSKPRKRGRPAAGGRDPIVTMRMPIWLIEGLDKYREVDGSGLSRSKLIREILQKYLRKYMISWGIWPNE